MHGTPNAANIGVRTEHLATADLLDLVPRIPHQVLGHALDLLLLEIPHADGLLAAVDVVRPQHGVFRRSGRDPELGLWVLRREACKE